MGEFCFWLCLVLFYNRNIERQLNFYLFQERDLDRALALAKGQLIFFGPETSGGGHLPGPFYYFLLALPTLFGGWQADVIVMLLFRSIGVFFIWRFLNRRAGFSSAVFATTAVMTSFTLAWSLWQFLNSSYVFPFAIVAVIALCETFAYSATDRVRRINWLLACASIAVGLQLHFTMVCLLASALALFAWCLRKNTPLQKLSYRDFRDGVILLLVSFLPYSIWLMSCWFHHPIGQLEPPYTGTSINGPVFLANVVFNMQAVNGVSQEIFRNLDRLFIKKDPTGTLLVFIYGLFFTQTLYYWGRKKMSRLTDYRPSAPNEQCGSPVYIVLLTVTLFTALPVILFLQVRAVSRYTYCFKAASIILAGILFSAILRRIETSRRNILIYFASLFGLCLICLDKINFHLLSIAGGFLLVFGLLYLLAEKKSENIKISLSALLICSLSLAYSFRRIQSNFFPESGIMSAAEATQVSRKIYDLTSWPYERAQKKIFFLNVDSEQSIRRIYQDAEKNATTANAASLRSPLDSPTVMIVAMNMQTTEDQNSIPELIGALKAQEMESSLVEGIRSGSLRPDRWIQIGRRVSILPLHADSRFILPDSLRNHNDGYTDARSLLDPESENGVASSETDFSDCPADSNLSQEACQIKIRLTAASTVENGTAKGLRVEVRGLPLSFGSDWIVPDWTESLFSPTLIFHCDHHDQEEFLADAIGTTYPIPDSKGNNFYLAPFSKTVYWTYFRNCLNPQIRFRYRSAIVYKRGLMATLPGRQVPLPLPR